MLVFVVARKCCNLPPGPAGRGCPSTYSGTRSVWIVGKNANVAQSQHRALRGGTIAIVLGAALAFGAIAGAPIGAVAQKPGAQQPPAAPSQAPPAVPQPGTAGESAQPQPQEAGERAESGFVRPAGA